MSDIEKSVGAVKKAAPVVAQSSPVLQSGHTAGAENTTEIQIPLPGGTFIKVTPPVENGDWTVGGLKVWEDSLEEKVDKFWHIPTPFFGLRLLLGAGLGFEFKAGGLALDSAERAYNFGWEFSANLAAGVAVDAWNDQIGDADAKFTRQAKLLDTKTDAKATEKTLSKLLSDTERHEILVRTIYARGYALKVEVIEVS